MLSIVHFGVVKRSGNKVCSAATAPAQSSLMGSAVGEAQASPQEAWAPYLSGVTDICLTIFLLAPRLTSSAAAVAPPSGRYMVSRKRRAWRRGGRGGDAGEPTSVRCAAGGAQRTGGRGAGAAARCAHRRLLLGHARGGPALLLGHDLADAGQHLERRVRVEEGEARAARDHVGERLGVLKAARARCGASGRTGRACGSGEADRRGRRCCRLPCGAGCLARPRSRPAGVARARAAHRQAKATSASSCGYFGCSRL